MVQCFPFQPVTHKQVPFLHWPCSLHRGSHCFKLHSSPDHPGKQSQALSTQCPWGPQSKSHNSGNRQGKLRFIFQVSAGFYCYLRNVSVRKQTQEARGDNDCWFFEDGFKLVKRWGRIDDYWVKKKREKRFEEKNERFDTYRMDNFIDVIHLET